MRATKESKTNKGITLIALVITIIVMLILVGVTISMAVNGGLFEQAGKAVGETNNALKAEQLLADGGIKVGDIWYNSIEEYLNKDKVDNVEKISKETSYVGYYADVDGDEVADGIIYADLALAKEGYYEAETGLKDYYISATNYEGIFGTKDVLTATGEGKERFYVMALSDISESQYSWYAIVWERGDVFNTSGDFGSGKANTELMIETWNADSDDAKNDSDVWGNIQTEVGKGWFLPSVKEWEAFLQEIDVTKVVEKEDELGSWEEEIYLISNEYYWTSVGGECSDAYHVRPYSEVEEDKYGTSPADCVYCIRLSSKL